MKILRTVMLVLLLMSFSRIQAQEFRFGIKSGMVVSGFTQTEQSLDVAEFDWNKNSSYSSGVFFNVRLRELISLQAELDYKQLGAHTRSSLQPEAKISYEFENLGFSILPRLDLFPDARFNPNIMVGPYADFRLESRANISQPVNSATSVFNNAFIGADTKEYTNLIVMGLAVAGGVEITTKPVIITLEGRYSSSFQNIFKDSVEDLPLNGNTVLLKLVENAKHEYFSVLVGFNFYFGR